MKSALTPYRNKLKSLFAQHGQSNAESSQPQDTYTEEPEPISVGHEPTDPPPFDERALTEQVAEQVGWNVGKEVQAKVSNRQMMNKHYVWATVEGWSELVLISVHNSADWPAGSRLWCQYAKANSDGHLVFNTKERGPKWRRK